MKNKKIKPIEMFLCILSLLIIRASSQANPSAKTPKMVTKEDSGPADRSTRLPYPFTNKEHKIEGKLYYEIPDLMASNIVTKQLKRGPSGEMLENPDFLPAYHKNEKVDYFSLEFPTFDVHESRIDQISEYVSSWMGLSPTRENVKCSFVTIDDKKVLNRIKAVYFNPGTGVNKTYTLDVKFIPEKITFKHDFREGHKLYSSPSRNPYFELNIGVQETELCRFIQQKLGNPKFFECLPYVNSRGFHPPNMFSVDVVLKGEMRKNILFHIVPFSKRPADPLSPDDNESPPEPDNTLVKIMLRYVNKRRPSNAMIYKFMVDALTSREFVERLNKFDGILEDFFDVYKEERSQIVEKFILKTRALLWSRKGKEVEDKMAFDENIKMMEGIADTINKWGVTKARDRALHIVHNHGDIKTYLVRRKRFESEYRIQKIYEYLDYLRYLKDQKIEKRFYNGFADD